MARPTLVWAAGARRLEVEEALRPLDGHRTVTGARIVHILTKLTKPSIPVNLVGTQAILPLWWVPASRGVFIFLCVIRRHFLACEVIAGGSDMSAGGTFFLRRYNWWVRAVSEGNIFFAKYRGPFGGSQLSGGGIIILCIIRRHFLVCGRGPSCQPLHVQSTADACRSLTMLTRPCRENHGGGRGRGLGTE